MKCFILALFCVFSFVSSDEDERLPNNCEGKTTKVTPGRFQLFVYRCMCHLNGQRVMFNLSLNVKRKKPLKSYFVLFQCVSFWPLSCRKLWKKPVAPEKSWRLEKCWTQAREEERSNTTPRKLFWPHETNWLCSGLSTLLYSHIFWGKPMTGTEEFLGELGSGNLSSG